MIPHPGDHASCVCQQERNMRPTLNILSEEMIVRILDEAKHIMAETGM
jgi:hypothetical protein